MKLYLKPSFFTEKEFLLAEEGGLRAVAFRYSTGIEALRIENSRGYFVILPYQGQQLWDIHFDGRDLKMITGIREPRQTDRFLKTYGGFLYHCGIRSMGAPDAEHPEHGDLPNCRYDAAWLEAGTDESGAWMEVGGAVEYRIAFTYECRFSPRCRLSAGKATVEVGAELENLRREPMEYAYLCHINFRPFDGGALYDTASRDPAEVTVHRVIPEDLSADAKKALGDYMDALEKDPSVMDKVGAAGQCYFPEICFTMRYKTDADGRGYTVQRLPEGGACYVCHPADQFPYGIRWISRTGTEASMGMILPATCEHLGYRYAKEHGQIRLLPPQGKRSYSLELGFLTEEEAAPVIEKIGRIRDGAKL